MTTVEKSLQDKLRAALRDATRQGFVREWHLRPGGRATIYPAAENCKYCTRHTLETFQVLSQLGWKP